MKRLFIEVTGGQFCSISTSFKPKSFLVLYSRFFCLHTRMLFLDFYQLLFRRGHTGMAKLFLVSTTKSHSYQLKSNKSVKKGVGRRQAPEQATK